MRKLALVVVLLLLVAAGGWFIFGSEPPRAVDDARAGAGPRTQVETLVKDSSRASDGVAEPAKASTAANPAKSRQAREAMRRRILDAMEARGKSADDEVASGTGAEDGGPAQGGEPTRPGSKPERPEDEAPAPGKLIDRTGNREHMVKVMNEDLIPLVDECYALARETQPELVGMMVLDVEMIGDEDIGGVVESIAAGQGNEIVDPALVECVHESLLSTTLPPPPEGGRDALQMSIRLEPDEG